MTLSINKRETPEIEVDDADLGYGKLFAMVLRQRIWFLGVLCGALSIAAISAINQEPVYESSFQLLIESNYRTKQSEQNKFEESNLEINNENNNYATLVEVMRNSQLLKRAKDILRSEYPGLDTATIENNFEIVQIEGDNYEEDRVKPNVFEADYTDNDPQKTKRVLETIIQVYQEYTLEQQKDRVVEGLAFINAQLPIAKEKVVQAENALEDFRKTHNLIDPQQRAIAIAAELKATKAQKRQIKVNYQNTLARYNAWQSQLERSPEQASVAARLSQSSRYTALLEELQKTELALKTRQAQFKSNAPVIQNLEEQLAEKRSLLKVEAQRILGVVPSDLDLTDDNLLKEGQLGDNDLKSAEELAVLKTQLDSLKAQEKALAQAEQELKAELDRFPSLIAEYNRLKPELDVQRATVEQLLSARQKLGIDIDREGLKWQVLEPPTLGEDITPSKSQSLLLGGVVGVFLGIGAALGREFLDDRVRSPQQLEQEMALPLLGVIPELPTENINKSNLDLLLSEPTDSEYSLEQTIYLRPLRESLDLIYQNVKLLNSASKNQSLLVTSVEAGVDNLALLFGLALSAVRSNQEVLLIDTNFRFPSLHDKLGIANDRGLSNLLTGEVTNTNIQTISLQGEKIDVLTAGSVISDPIKLLSSSRLKQLMFAFERNYDLVLLNSPPVLGYVDVFQTAQLCQGVVLLEKIDRITKSKLTEANALLSQLNVIGVVADGGETSEAKLRKIYEPQWQSMLNALPPADAN